MRAVKSRWPARIAAAWILLLLLSSTVAPSVGSFAQAADGEVKFEFSNSEIGTSTVDVKLSFTINEGKEAVLKPPEGASIGEGGSPGLSLNLLSRSRPELEIEPLDPPESGWLLTAARSQEATISYRVSYMPAPEPESPPEDCTAVLTPYAIAEEDLKAFKGSDLFIAPLRPADSAPIAESYVVAGEVPESQEVLAPWARADEASNLFEIADTKLLEENYLVWGDIEILIPRDDEPRIAVGFSSDYDRLEESEREQYSRRIASLYSYLDTHIGPRKGAGLLTVLCAGASRFKVGSPSAATLMDSVLLFHGGSRLEGDSAAAASGGLFDLWNRYEFVPDSSGDARWFQEGLCLFYPLRVASLEGMMEPAEAFRDLTSIYSEYLTRPDALSISLVEAGASGDTHLGLLRTKGATVVAAISERLWDETEGSLDIDWLIATIAEKYPRSGGEEYGLVDVSETLEEETESSWDRFFSEKVTETGVVDASEFSSTDLFGARSSSVAGAELETEGSGTSWIYLAVAVFVIFLIPVIFSAYVRRSIKMDFTMPKILPDEDEEGEN